MSIPVGISGSRSAAILGVSPYRTNLDIWLEIMESREPGFCEKHGYKFEPFTGNIQTDFGSAFEDAICEIVEVTKGIKIADRERFYDASTQVEVININTDTSRVSVEDQSYITCHIDGMIEIDGETCLIENKTTSSHYFYDNFSEKLNRIPLNYMCQIQHNLYLTGLNKCMMNVLVFPKRVDEFVADGWSVIKQALNYYLLKKDEELINPLEWAYTLSEMGYLKTFIIERDDDLIKLMLEKYSTFWNENILKGIMPDVVNIDDIKAIYTEPKGTVVASEQVERWVSERKLLMLEKKEIETKIEQLKTLELEYMRQSDDKVIDEETRDKTFLMSRAGKKLAQYNGKVYR